MKQAWGIRVGFAGAVLAVVALVNGAGVGLAVGLVLVLAGVILIAAT